MQRLTESELRAIVPSQLQRKARWVGHWNKQPLDVVRGGGASTTDPATWATFDQVMEWYAVRPEPEAGIGFVFSAADDLVFVDLDGALGDDGCVQEWAVPLIDRLKGTYLEVSPSGKGLHAFLRGSLARASGVTGGRIQPPGAKGAEKLEVYADRRFSTVTGWRMEGHASDAEPGQEALDQILFETGLGERLLGGGLTRREVPAAPPEPVVEGEVERVASALESLDPDCGYEEWVQIGMALKSGLGEDGLPLWLDWSSRGAKCKPGEPERKWQSFRRGGVGLGTLFHRALATGWTDRKDALDEFAGVAVPEPVERDGEDGEVPYHTKTVGRGKGMYDEFVKGPENVYLYFSRDVKWKGRLRWNERRGEVELDGKPLTDSDLVDLSGAVSRAMDWSPAIGLDTVFQAVTRAAKSHAYDPVRDWLKGLEWDGQGRLDRFCADVGLEDTEATRRYFRMWALGAVARAFEPGCSMPYVLVLCGPQGAGKSRLAQALAVSPEWYHESAVTLGDKDAYLATLGPWVFEIAELAGMRRTDQERVKAFVSEKESRFRAPYGKVQETHPRRLVFVATTNDEQYGRDATGARRWLDIGVTAELRIPTPSEMAQVWAEAVVQYHRGARRFENAEEMAETNQRGEIRREQDPVEVAAVEAVRELARQGATTLAEVLEVLRGRNVTANTSRAVTTALRKEGWVSKVWKLEGIAHRVWMYPGAPKEAAAAAVERRRGYHASDN